MRPNRDGIDVATALPTLRPKPRPEFAAELDARAAAGFPRRDGGSSVRGRIASWLERVPGRRLPAFASAAAAVAIAVATAVVAISEEGGIPTAPDRGLPTEERLSASSSAGQSGEAAAGEAAAGPSLLRAASRQVERSARIVLATDPSEMQAAASRVFETVHGFDGVVMRSSVRDSSGGDAGAIFDLRIPSGRLRDAMAAFSEIAAVKSRSEATLDVTAPAVGLEERLRDARTEIESLLARLASAESESERIAVEAELRGERRRLASLRSQLTALQRRTRFSRVALRIEGTAATASDGRWGVDDAVRESGRILAIAAGVTLIALAVVAPLALICLLAWLARRH